MPEFDNLKVTVEANVARVALDRPNKANALNAKSWIAIGEAFAWLDATPEVRSIVLFGEGKNFTAGIDFGLIATMVGEAMSLPEGKKQEHLRSKIVEYQAAFTAVEKCRKPVVAAVHGSCFGAGVDLITACDIRLSTNDARYCVKEVDLAIVADVGTLQRLPTIVGEGLARELALTAREFSGAEAREMRLVSRTFDDQESLMKGALEVATLIAEKSPIATRGVKQVMNYCRDHSVVDGLDYVATWNAGMLLSADGQEAFAALMEKRAPKYQD